MKPPINTKVFEGYLATFWLDESGILYAKGKKVPRSLQTQKENYEFIKQITGNKKVCLLSDTTTTSPQDKATRDYIETELPNMFTAMAIISKSAVGEIIPKLFTTINKQSIPMQFFSSETEAKQWLKQYL
jgi:hypothetical protein